MCLYYCTVILGVYGFLSGERIYIIFFFFFKQKTAYELRISDWSSDVCSSDLLPDGTPLTSALQRMATARRQEAATIRAQGQKNAQIIRAEADAQASQIGRASCRERVCQYV